MDLKERVEDAILCRFKWSLLPFSVLSAILCLRLPPCIDQMLANYPKTIANKCRLYFFNDSSNKKLQLQSGLDILKGVVLLMKSSYSSFVRLTKGFENLERDGVIIHRKPHFYIVIIRKPVSQPFSSPLDKPFAFRRILNR